MTGALYKLVKFELIVPNNLPTEGAKRPVHAHKVDLWAELCRLCSDW